MAKDKNKKRNEKKAKQFINEFKGESVDDVLASEDYLAMSPAAQKMIGVMLDYYDPETLGRIKLTPLEIQKIEKQAEKIARKEFKISKKQLEQDFQQSVKQDAEDVKSTIAQKERDLADTLARGDQDAAEQIKMGIRELQDTLSYLNDDYTRATEAKNEQLQSRLAEVRDTLSRDLGAIDEDEAYSLRQQERQLTQQIEGIQSEAQALGMTFSSKRFGDEGTAQETASDTMSMTRTEAERRRVDSSRQAEFDVGSESLSDISGARLLGGVEGQTTMLTRQELADIAARYGVNVANAVSSAEATLGSDQTQAVSQSYGVNTTGGVQGSALKEKERGASDASKAYQDYVDYAAKQYERTYGTGQLEKQVGSDIGSYGDYSGYQEGGYFGSARRSYKRAKQENRQTRKDTAQYLKDTFRSTKESALL